MSVEATLAERGSRYGDFSIHAEIAQNLQDDMRATGGWEHLSPVQKQALTVIADKIARVLSGDPNYGDNWHDIQGYAKLVEDRIVDISKDPAEQYMDMLRANESSLTSVRICADCQCVVPAGPPCPVCNP